MDTTDVFGNTAKEGDTVCFILPRYSQLIIGQVIKVTPKGFTIKYNDGKRDEIVSRRSYQVAKK